MLPWPRSSDLLQHRAQVFDQLATLLNAGIPLQRSLGMVKIPSQEQWGHLLQQASRHIDVGATLTEAIAANQPQSWLSPPYFDEWTLGVLRLAEASGALAEGCRQLAIAARQQQQRQRLETAIGRSLLALVISGLTLAMALLQWGTGFILQPWFSVLVISLSLGFSWGWQQAQSGPLRATIQPYLRQWPILKSLWEAQVCLYLSELATPLRCGLPILTALDLMRRQAPDPELAKTLTLLIHGVRSGRSLSQILTGRIPDLALQLIRTGEETGALDETLGRLGEYGQESLAMTLQQVQTVLRPLAIVAIGGMVAITAIQLFSGLLQQLPD
ncbi:type II secretion system F family protein [Trichothermofontia sichuanensis B231]|uniref:type II secretion system F family protein n=1 Tax=Trichothermofontia sichuanensis TaxID=3045816 RepID=UPI002248396A|nr:type II secretion system F family protein [Trichothermofontia sichuanensis]UZQ54817.1 type II secretion system F family protein [Trichothermofontia sichuanensis B231]